MIGDNRDIALSVELVHAAHGVGHYEGLGPQKLHDAGGEGDILHGVAFVKMHAPVHGDHFLARELPYNQLARMTEDR